MNNKNKKKTPLKLKSNTNTIKKYRYYPDFLFYKLDAWLNRMSKKGYHLIHYGIFTYVFEKGNPENREFFSYSSERVGDGKYSISLRYPNLEKTYGKKSKNSKLNKANITKGINIVEIDTYKVSSGDIGYKELISDRNKLYFMRAIRNTAAILVMLLILFFVLYLEKIR